MSDKDMPWEKVHTFHDEIFWGHPSREKHCGFNPPVEVWGYLVPEKEAQELWNKDQKQRAVFQEYCATGQYNTLDMYCILRDLKEQNTSLKRQVKQLEEKNQDYLDAMGDAVSTLCLRAEKIEGLKKQVAILKDGLQSYMTDNNHAAVMLKKADAIAAETIAALQAAKEMDDAEE